MAYSSLFSAPCSVTMGGHTSSLLLPFMGKDRGGCAHPLFFWGAAITPPAPLAPRQLSNFPTSRKDDKPKSWQVGKLASWHTPPAGPGRGEQRSTPPRTPCSSPTFPSSPPPHLRSPLPRLTPPVDLTRLNVPPCTRPLQHWSLRVSFQLITPSALAVLPRGRLFSRPPPVAGEHPLYRG